MGQRQSTSMPGSFEEPFEAEKIGEGCISYVLDPDVIKYWVDKLLKDHIFKDNILQQEHPNPQELCPYYQATFKVKAFIFAVHASLAAGDFHACAAAHNNVLKHLCQAEAPFHDSWEFHDWICDAMTLNPQRRTALMNSWVYIVESDDDLKTKLDQVIDRHDAHLRWVEEIDNLLQDPDELWMFDSANIKHIGVFDKIERRPTSGDVCDICQEEYSPQWKWMYQGPHVPMLCPCGHVFCKSCLEVWKKEAPGAGYNCPLCRQCLVCGSADCKLHQVFNREPNPPMPLPDILRWINADNGNTKNTDRLYGFSPEVYWDLREYTRSLRVDMEEWDRQLAKMRVENPDHPEREEWETKCAVCWRVMRDWVEHYKKHYSKEELPAAPALGAA